MVERSERVNHGHVYPRPDGAKARCGGPGFCRQCRREAMGIEVPPLDQVSLWAPRQDPWVQALLRDEPAMPYADLRDLQAVSEDAHGQALVEHDRFLEDEYFELRYEQDAAGDISDYVDLDY